MDALFTKMHKNSNGTYFFDLKHFGLLHITRSNLDPKNPDKYKKQSLVVHVQAIPEMIEILREVYEFSEDKKLGASNVVSANPIPAWVREHVLKLADYDYDAEQTDFQAEPHPSHIFVSKMFVRAWLGKD